MSNYQEAVRAIQANYPPENYTMLREGLDLAIEVLEKQIPKDVNSKCDEDWEYYYCGNCNVNVDEDNNYCVNCGQKLDWD